MRLEIQQKISSHSEILNEVKEQLEKGKDDIISFSGQQKGYCVGLVDIVNSTRIAAKLSNNRIGEFYSVFLNSMSIIAKKYDAKIIKNIGDSILFYFPTTIDGDKLKITTSINCALTMIDAKQIINDKIKTLNLPPLCYRISLDYGVILLAQSSLSSREDIFGSTVNICSKINRMAQPGGVVIGHDLYQMIQDNLNYDFESISSYSAVRKFNYSVHSVKRKTWNQ